MTKDQLTALARSGESETLEFKQSTGLRREGIRALCAMLNHRGGRLLFGVTPERQVVGQQLTDKSVEDVAAEIKLIDPPAFPTVERIDLGDCREVLVLTVTQGQGRPYSYKGQAYRRVGNTSPELSRDAYNQMLLERLHGMERWENRVADGWQVMDLDAAEVTRTIDEAVRRGRSDDPGTREPMALLRGLGLTQGEQLLQAAIVLFGRRERLELNFPQCLLRVARFRGIDKTEFIDNRQLYGNAFDLLPRAERFMRENLPVAGRVVPNVFERQDDPLYPPVALREALANALCHRDYSIGGGSVAVAIYDDRLEITSSGTLHFGLTVDSLFQPHESLPWNPLIARVLYRRGVIESWGRGTLKMAELAESAGLPRPQIEEAGGCVTVRFKPGHYVVPARVGHALPKRQQRLLSVLRRRDQMPLREIRAAIGPDVPDWQLKKELAHLKSLGIVSNAGYGRGAYWYLRKK